MRLWLLRFAWIMLCSTLLAAAPGQAAAPTPAPGLLQTCLDDGPGKCLAQAWDEGGWLLLLVIFILFLVWIILRTYFQGWLEAWKKRGKKDADQFFAADDLDEATRRYLEYASTAYRHFKFRGLPRVRAKGIEPPELDQAYISLRMAYESENDLERENQNKENKPGTVERLAKHPAAESIGLAEALQQTHKLAIIGAAGSGKSTLLQWAGLACVRARLDKGKLTAEQRTFMAALGSGKPPLPVLVPLRAFDEYCKKNQCTRTPKALYDFLTHYFEDKLPGIKLPESFFSRHLQQGCLLMFDGVDEVDPDDRGNVRQAVEDLGNQFKNERLYCLITSRPSAAYIPGQMVDFHRCDVQPLLPEQRDELIRFWYHAVIPDNESEARRKAVDLISRINASSPRVRDLATTPLMVTIFSMVHYSRDELPRQRAKLYEDAVEVLLTEVLHHEGEEAAGLQHWGGLDWETRRDRLAHIAFELHHCRRETMLESDLVDLIWPRFGSQEESARKEAAQFLRRVAERGGLLEGEDESYGFLTHRTFQEYLAGRYLVEEYPPEKLPGFLEDHAGDDLWEEPIRLAAGYLAIKGEGQANRFIRLLAGLEKNVQVHAKALALAGLALSDLPADRVLPDTREKVSASSLELLTVNPPKVSAPLRSRLGLALGAIGDPRLAARKGENFIRPEMVPVPAGAFQMGTSDDDVVKLKAQETSFYPDEQPAHRVTLSEFSIGKYPVTNAEFRCFWEAGAYGQVDGAKPGWWSAAGWRWRTGQWESDLSIYSEKSKESIRRWLALRPVEKRDCPLYWYNPDWNGPNLPVVGVCWFEAEAYCGWLSDAARQLYRLPAEAEWEKAARFWPAAHLEAEHTTLWPWGDAWDAAKCNNTELEDTIGRTSPAGMYPHGASPSGAQDMAGNVWEWCADWYAANEYQRRVEKGQPVMDPYGPETGEARVVRGGSWYYNSRSDARCAFRDWGVPGLFNYSIGFRLVLSPNGI